MGLLLRAPEIRIACSNKLLHACEQMMLYPDISAQVFRPDDLLVLYLFSIKIFYSARARDLAEVNKIIGKLSKL